MASATIQNVSIQRYYKNGMLKCHSKVYCCNRCGCNLFSNDKKLKIYDKSLFICPVCERPSKQRKSTNKR